ncbi:hypothetical protein J6590_044567 [Homalodisca vitripennis]|nr:hypothetical protein J6590_044567 [Homalodisca vitripennis]
MKEYTTRCVTDGIFLIGKIQEESFEGINLSLVSWEKGQAGFEPDSKVKTGKRRLALELMCRLSTVLNIWVASLTPKLTCRNRILLSN